MKHSSPSNMSVRMECSICVSTLREADEVFASSCKHIFHSRCLSRWLKENTGCPICRIPDVSFHRLFITFTDKRGSVDRGMVEDLEAELHWLRELQEQREFERDAQVRQLVEDERLIRSLYEEAVSANQELRQQLRDYARLDEEREQLQTRNEQLQLRNSSLMQQSEDIREAYRYLHPQPGKTWAAGKLTLRGFEEAEVSDPQQAITHLIHRLGLQSESSRFSIVACVELRAHPGKHQITIQCADSSLKLELVAHFQSPLPEMRSATANLKMVDSVQVSKFYKYATSQLRCKRGIARLGLSNDQILIQISGAEGLVELQNEGDVAKMLETLDQLPTTSKRRRAKRKTSPEPSEQPPSKN